MIHLVAGTYAERGGRGLIPLTYEPAHDRLSAGAPISTVANASAGVSLPDGGFAFVDERAWRVFIVREEGWCPVASFGSGGAGPCHLAVDREGRVLAAANYEDGTVALFSLDGGASSEPVARYRDSGHGPDPDRQDGAHAHWVGFVRDQLYAVDLGTDRILSFDRAAEGRLHRATVAYTAPPGSGPRQLAFHPTLPIAYLVSELASTLTVLAVERDGTLAPRRTLSTLPANAPADSLAGAIALDAAGKRLFVSNRGHDSIAAFAIDAKGDAALIDIVASGGRSPRYLLLFEPEQRLLVAHEQAGGVTVRAVDHEGRLHATSAHADVPGAVFLARLGEIE